MSFKALFIREDVYAILKDTLYKYYSSMCVGNVYVGYEPKDGAARFEINTQIGFIYQSFPCKSIRQFLYNSFDIRNNVMKRIAAKAFVFLSTHTKYLFTKAEPIYIFPSSLVNKHILISYLNRSIRILNFKEGTTTSIQKVSFTSKFFNNQLQFRLSHRYYFIPEIIDYSDFWFTEQIIEGKSLARITDAKTYRDVGKKVLQNMLLIQKDTVRYVDATVYLNQISERCRFLLEQARIKKRIETYQITSSYLKLLSSHFSSNGLTLPISETHGDLQAGNIMVTNNNIWIIDWETHAERSVWFDGITLMYGTRYYGGIKTFLEDKNILKLKNVLLQGFECDILLKDMVIIFLLEDLFFNLEDMMELPDKSGKESFDAYIRDIFTTDFSKTYI